MHSFSREGSYSKHASLLYDTLPSSYKLIKNSAQVKPSVKWNKDDNKISPKLVDLSFFGTRYEGKQYRVLASFERKVHLLEGIGRRCFGALAVATVIPNSIASPPWLEISDPFKRRLQKIFITIYSNGQEAHAISQYITKELTARQFMNYYTYYAIGDLTPGINDGLLEKALAEGNIEVLKFIIEEFGDNLICKEKALSDLIIASVELLNTKELKLKKVTAIVHLLIASKASLNAIAKEPELKLCRRPTCKYHKPLTVLDALFCRFSKKTAKDWRRCQPIFNLLIESGAQAYPGKTCCKRKEIKSA